LPSNKPKKLIFYLATGVISLKWMHVVTLDYDSKVVSKFQIGVEVSEIIYYEQSHIYVFIYINRFRKQFSLQKVKPARQQ
jgi:hypothetical protein